jgi:hypothetical protein
MTELNRMMDILRECSVKDCGLVWEYTLVDPSPFKVTRYSTL